MGLPRFQSPIRCVSGLIFLVALAQQISQTNSGSASTLDETTRHLCDVAAEILRKVGHGPDGHVTIVGGLVPTLRSGQCTEPPSAEHQGTGDLDLVLSLALLRGETANYYQDVASALREAGLAPGKLEPGNDKRWQWQGEVLGLAVKVELLAKDQEGHPAGHPQPLPVEGSAGGDPTVLTVLGVTYAEMAHVDRELVAVDVAARHGTLPGYQLPVAGLASWLALKGEAVMRRDKDKDAYDIVWLLRCLGPELAADMIEESKLWNSEHAPLLGEALRQLRSLFADADGHACGAAAAYLRDAGLDDASDEVLRRRARDAVQETMDALHDRRRGF